MPLNCDELVCPKFQPNIFDSSRCHDCLRLKHQHGAHAHTPPAHTTANTSHTPARTVEQENVGTESSGGSKAPHSSDEKEVSHKGVVTRPTNQDDSDEVSVVSGYCEVSRGSLCILSPGCDLYLCDGDDDLSSDSQSEDDSASSTSFATEDDFHPLYCHRMTRLDPPPHRTNPRAWMDEAQSHDRFRRHSSPSHASSRVEREQSGYFSLGRAAGARTFQNKSPPPPYRHSERGHPLPGNRSPERKATIPFRNPDLGVPSERRTNEIQNPEIPPVSSSPEPVDLSLEVEAQVGPRSLSPTPFKQAESLGTSGRRGMRTSYSSSYQNSGTFHQGASLSRSSSPPRSYSPFKRTESLSSLPSRGFGFGGVTLDSLSQRRDQGSRSPSQSSYGRQSDTVGLQKNFRSFASNVGTITSTAKSMSGSYNDLRAGLRKAETTSSHGGNTRSSSPPPRRGYESPAKSFQKTEPNSFSNRKGRESRSSSLSRKPYESNSQSYLHKNGEGRRSASPIRKGYGARSQTETSHLTDVGRSLNSSGSSPSRKRFETSSQSQQKSENSSTRSHSHDSRHSSPSRRSYDTPGQSVLRKTEAGRSSSYSHGLSSRSPSPSRRGYDTPSKSILHKSEPNSSKSSSLSKTRSTVTSQSVLRKTVSDFRAVSSSYVRKSPSNTTSFDARPNTGLWRGSTHSLSSPPLSRSSSPSRKSTENKPTNYSQKHAHVVWESACDRNRSSSNVRHSRDAHSPAPDSRRSSHHNRSPSPHMHRHTSSQSSMDSSESGHLSASSSGLNREEYATMADLPKVKIIFQKEGPNRLEQLENRNRAEPSLYKPASHSQTKAVYRSWDDLEQTGAPSSSSSLHTQRDNSPDRESTSYRDQRRGAAHSQGNSRPSVYFSSSVDQAEDDIIHQPDLLNFKKGWMSKQDASGEWKKHWFVLTDAGLRYYRDSAAEEKDELDGEIDLRSCVKVSEFDVEKNYGFQIQTHNAVFTLSAMTAGIRRNWIEVLRKNIRPSSTPDLTQLPDSSSSDKENSRLLSSRRALSQSEAASTPNPTHRRFDYVELSPVATPPASAPANQREAGEGQVREQREEHVEERGRDSAHSQWEGLVARKGAGPGVGAERKRLEEDIERKWAEFERLPLKEMRSLPPMGARSGPLANQALQREVASLRQQLARDGGGGVGVGGVCVCVCGGGVCGGRQGCCGAGLQQMEQAHQQALQEMERLHSRQTAQLQSERDRLLQEEMQATACAMEVLRKAHQEELEREVQKAKTLAQHTTNTHTAREQELAELQALKRELEGLSERYSQKCLELNRLQQNNGATEREMSIKEREMEQLRKDNQELQTRLAEEIGRVSCVVIGQDSAQVTGDDQQRPAHELQVLVRVKQHEVDYLHKEISCLRNELLFLTTEKQSVCSRHREVCEELRVMKERSEREVQALREHLRLAMAALQEGQRLGNSLQH